MQFWNQDRWRLGHIVGMLIAFAVEVTIGFGYRAYLYDYLGFDYCSGFTCPDEVWQSPFVWFFVGVILGAIIGCFSIHTLAPRSFTIKLWLECTASIAILLLLANIVSFLVYVAVWAMLYEMTDLFRYDWKYTADDVISFFLFLALFIIIPGITLGLFAAGNGLLSQSAENPQAD
jgi:hypothetical protein